MSQILHLTNGTAIIPLMREVGIAGPIVPWNDVLHEGPVPTGLGTAALRERRAEFLAECGWGARDRIAREMEERDRQLDDAVAGRVDEIVLWFEHDLFDQLQVLQILDRVPSDGGPRVTAVQATTYLGTLPAADFPDLFEYRRFVTSAERLAARDAWTAFRSADPRALVDVLPRVTGVTHLRPALTRHLEQFPAIVNGLSRTEQQTLDVVAGGTTRLGDVYLAANHSREEAVFMGDAAFLVHIAQLVRDARPLLRAETVFDPADAGALNAHVRLTADGALVRAGESDRVAFCGIDRWLGGVQLAGTGPVWRWDRDRQTVRMK